MKKKILKSIIMIGIIVTMNLLLTTVSNAALTITPSKKTVAPGESFNVTVSVGSDEAGAISISASNATLSQTYVDLMSQTSVTIPCVAGSSGTISLNATGLVANYVAETEITQNASNSVTIVEPTPEPPPTTSNNSSSSNNTSSSSSSNKTSTSSNSNKTITEVKKSNNSKLAKLEIAEGVITPEFDSSVKEYSINVSNEVTKLSISAIADSSKATVSITGNEELQVGDNNIEVIVTAEDGSTSTYTILTKRAYPELSLQALTVSYVDKNGEKVDLLLNPEFVFNMFEYSIDTKLPHTVQTLDIVGTANRENAIVEIIGNEELKTGDNLITIKVVLTDEAGLEEQKTYTIKVEKEKEPVVATLTTMGRIRNWFKGTGTTISAWLTQNFNKIIAGLLFVATVTFVGLTIYFIYDYKNYQKVLAKLAELNKANLMERANVALDPEMANINNSIGKVENIETENLEQENNILEEMTQEKLRTGKGRRFK